MFLNHEEKDLKIIDFGVGTSFKENTNTTLKVGSVLDLLFRSTTLPLKLSRKSITINVISGPLALFSTFSLLEDLPLLDLMIKIYTEKLSKDKCPTLKKGGRISALVPRILSRGCFKLILRRELVQSRP